jgi:uncharacterized membrane protein
MNNYLKIFNTLYYNVVKSIAFFPFLISVLLLAAAIFMIYFSQTPLNSRIIDEYSYLWIKGPQSARDILTTIIAGVLSLSVFSFSMVMIVLNQASQLSSPRVIPGLVTKKSHQIILGLYLGTIIYSIILLHNVTPDDYDRELPQFGIFFAEFLGILCLSLFVYFIHSISKSIQIDVIILNISGETYERIKKDLKASSRKVNEDSKSIDTKDWQIIKSRETGYFSSLNEKLIIPFLKEHDLILEIMVPKGSFIGRKNPFLKINKKISEDKEKEILEQFIVNQEEYTTENYVYGLKQLSEIAVKALSPGINDPGTAIKALDQLSILFEKLLDSKMFNYSNDDQENVRIIHKLWSFNELFYTFLTPVRLYGGKDPLVIRRLLDLFKNLLYSDSGEHNDILQRHVSIIVEDARTKIKNSADKEAINNILDEMNNLLDKKVNHI